MLDDRIIVQDRTADYGLAALLQNTNKYNCDPYAMMAMMGNNGFGNNGGWWMWMILLLLWGGNGFNGNRGNAQFAELQS